jgi:glutamate/tyrosine decarboxylase-like PLP-dependent enzyme
VIHKRVAYDALIFDAARRAAAYLAGLDDRRVAPSSSVVTELDRLAFAFPSEPTPPEDVLALLDDVGSPATVASAGGRYFGFVIGGALPTAVAASYLATAWDQDCGYHVMSPATARFEEVALGWLTEVLQLPAGTGGGFVTGATMANFSGLAAARHALLARLGWDVERRGLFGAPELRVVVGDHVHISLVKALGMVGLGRDRVIRVPADDQGRMRPDALPTLDDRTILCLQAGNVNSGAFDPAPALCAAARAAGAWVHVDGAFGLWAAAAPARAYHIDGFDGADSWALDAHKWLNVPYDSGLVFCRAPEVLRETMSASAAYLAETDGREPCHYTPEMSRRARGVEVWAALSSLGRSGLADLVERCCVHAATFARALGSAGFEILNQVELNQVLVAFGDDERTRRVIDAVQREGTCWVGGTTWFGRAAMRISVSSWVSSPRDVELSIEAIVRCARAS